MTLTTETNRNLYFDVLFDVTALRINFLYQLTDLTLQYLADLQFFYFTVLTSISNARGILFGAESIMFFS